MMIDIQHEQHIDKHLLPRNAAHEIGELVDARIGGRFHIPADSALSMIEEIITKACVEYARITLLERESLAEHCLRDVLYSLTAMHLNAEEIIENALHDVSEYFQDKRQEKAEHPSQGARSAPGG